MKRLYANGCSMTFGSEIAGDTTEDPMLSLEQNAYRLQKCWSGVAAARLGLSLINRGQGGSSNDRILRTTVQHCLELELGPNDLVIIGWSESERMEYVQRHRWVQQTVNHRPARYAEKRFVDDYARLMLNDPARIWEKFLVQVLCLQSFLRERSIPYLMFNALPAVTIDNYPRIDNSNEALAKSIDPEHWVNDIGDFASCMFCQMVHLPVGPEKHPLEEGHALWGSRVYEKAIQTFPDLAPRVA